MRIVEPYAKMLNSFDMQMPEFRKPDGVCMLRRVEYYARVSHASEDAMTADSWERFIRSVVLEHGDWSVVEHEKVTAEFLVDRGIGYELVRHRIRSGWNEDCVDQALDGQVALTQESTRFVNYQKRGGEAKFIVPVELGDRCSNNYNTWEGAMQAAELAYMALCSSGVKPQIARSVLPNALATKVIVTYNLRSWRHFFMMRTSAEAHPQMRQVVDPLLREFQEKVPILYEDIEPGRRQRRAMEAAR